MKGLILLIVLMGIVAFLYFSGVFNGHSAIQRIYNETVVITSSSPATVYKQVSVPTAGWVDITLSSNNPVVLELVNGTSTIYLGQGTSIHAREYLAGNFTLVLKNLNGVAEVQVVETY